MKPEVLVSHATHKTWVDEMFTEQLKVGDELDVIGLRVVIRLILQDSPTTLALRLDILGATDKKKSKMTLVVPKGMPAEVMVKKGTRRRQAE